VQDGGLSPRTIQWYGQNLSAFTEFLDDPPFKDLTLEDAGRFVAHLLGKGIQPQTIHDYVRSL